MRFLDVEGEHFVGFAGLAVDLLDDHPRAPDGQLVTLAAHGFEEDRQVQLAASGDEEAVGVGRFLDAQRHVGQQLLAQALADLPTGDELAFGAGQGELLTMKVMFSVGSSMRSIGSASGSRCR
jgi:hypothetical protein